ncbi:hypothetical protein V6N13_107162 [Hibiscus sabdariffa]|uniref:Uncharacterized protein n=1 Tax=Hibiscus sabdariffa TaxID=183260 RepID=A0ABR2F310_9ROSI
MGSEMKDKGSSFSGDGRSEMGLDLKVFGWLNGLAAVMGSLLGTDVVMVEDEYQLQMLRVGGKGINGGRLSYG